MLSGEQAAVIKKQLMEHIEKSFHEERKAYDKEQVEHMDSKELGEFLKNNNLVAGQDSKCILCSIVFGDIPSYKIEENSEAIAVLEINPVSKGHSLVILKKHTEESSSMPKEAEKLAKKVSRRIKSKLKPKRVDTLSTTTFGHHVINILPIYADETMSSRRQPAKKNELEETEKLLKVKPRSTKSNFKKSVIKKIEKAVEGFEKKLWLPQRIP